MGRAKRWVSSAGRLGVVAVIASLTVGSSGLAAEGHVVARDGSVELRATSTGHELCLAVESRSSESECGAVPSSADAPVRIFRFDRGTPYAIAVAPSVASIGLEGRHGERRLQTVGADGFDARFLLVADPGFVRLSRFYAADGTLIAAAEDEGIRRERRGLTTLRRFRRGEAVRVYGQPRLRPTREQPDRVVTAYACAMGVDHERDPQDVCGSHGIDDTFANLDSAHGCDGRTDVIYGIARPGVAAVVLRLGDGRVVRSRTLALPDGLGDGRGVAIEIPDGAAVRSFALIARGGRLLAREQTGLPPAGGNCAARHLENCCGPRFERPLRFRTPQVAVARSRRHRLLVADTRVGTCFGIDRIPRGPRRQCYYGGVPATGLLTGLTLIRSGATVAAVATRDVARIDLRFAHHRVRTIRARTGDAYTGVFRGHVRFAIASVPAGQRITGATIRDADGHVLRHRPEDISLPEALIKQRVVIHHRGMRLVSATFLPRRDRCAFPAAAGGPLSNPVITCEGWFSDISVLVGCHPGQALLSGRAPRGVRDVAVTLDDGRRLTAPLLRARPRRMFAVLPPPGSGVRSLRVGERRTRLDLPPATEQCGYTGSP